MLYIRWEDWTVQMVRSLMMILRFVARSGDAMGMNMLSKATEFAINRFVRRLDMLEVVLFNGVFLFQNAGRFSRHGDNLSFW